VATTMVTMVATMTPITTIVLATINRGGTRGGCDDGGKRDAATKAVMTRIETVTTVMKKEKGRRRGGR